MRAECLLRHRGEQASAKWGLEVLRHVPLFADLNKRKVQEIARLFKEHRFSKGETVVKEGSGGDTFFLIDSGEATVFIGGRGRTTLKPGTISARSP